LNLSVLAAFLPWLPIAADRLLNWPHGRSSGLVAGLELTLRTLLFGPLRAVPEPLWPWLALTAGLPLAGWVALRHNLRLAVLALCGWLLPVAMMFGLGLFTDAFFEFLLVASLPGACWWQPPRWPRRAGQPPRRKGTFARSALVCGGSRRGCFAWLLHHSNCP
jgi:hypothetical protein